MKIKYLFYIGETPVILAEFYDAFTHDLVDPEAVKVSLYDPEGNLKIDGAAAARDETGKYHYDVNTNNFSIFGEYAAIVEATRDGRVSAEKTVFTLRPRP
jgi:hypothetical protein